MKDLISQDYQERKIKNNMGVMVHVHEGEKGFSLGGFFYDGELLEAQNERGVFHLRHVETGKVVEIYASRVEKLSPTRLVLSGTETIAGVSFEFFVTLEAPIDVKAVTLNWAISFERDISGYEICLLYHNVFKYAWKAHLYPWVADSKWVERNQLDNMGIPSIFLYREDRTRGVLWGIDPNSDYLNPTTWTRDFGAYFIDYVLPPHFRVGGGELKKDIKYDCPMQIVISDQSDPDLMITDLMKSWMALNQYRVLPLDVRANDEALELFIEGRRESLDAWIPGKGYSLHGARHTFLYFGVQSMGAYFDYLLYELTGDAIWRERAFEQLDFIVQGQNLDRDDFNYGAIHTTYQLEWMQDYGKSGPGFNSDDRFNVGYKPDVTALLVRYMLLMWKRLKDHEGVDRTDWYQTAILAADWIIRQQNNDGGLPQKVQERPVEMRWFDEDFNLVIKPFKSRSATSGRALPSLSQIVAISGDERYSRFLESLEEYTLRCVQSQYYFTGHHPDLPPYELEEASIWGVAEYWLNRYDETRDEKYLKHAEANAYLALSWWCPKDLSWVKNPTQGGSAEQQHFQQYSVYNYQNRKIEGLWRLFHCTGNILFKNLMERMLQNIYFTQETEGGNKGGTYERIADPWLVRVETAGGPHFDSLGSNYTNEQALDCFLQILEIFRMGRQLYEGKEFVNTIFPDGECFYNQDISYLRQVPLQVLPSSGKLSLSIDEWKASSKTWRFNTTNSDVSISNHVKDLDPRRSYSVIVNREQVGQYISNSNGKISFTISGNFQENTILIFRKEDS
jgi:hypothetical protein